MIADAELVRENGDNDELETLLRLHQVVRTRLPGS
jgi:hypothetical protein